MTTVALELFGFAQNAMYSCHQLARRERLGDVCRTGGPPSASLPSIVGGAAVPAIFSPNSRASHTQRPCLAAMTIGTLRCVAKTPNCAMQPAAAGFRLN